MFLSRLRPAVVLPVIYRDLSQTVMRARGFYLRRFWGMDIAAGCVISISARLDKSHPRGIHIGQGTAVQFGACILTRDEIHQRRLDTWIGKECQIGARSIIFPGVKIGDNCVVTAASVVLDDVPPNSMVAGNPARIIEKGINTGRWGAIDRVVQGNFGQPSPAVEQGKGPKSTRIRD
jgi:acetyltransferase-like isoleucine patch superfamily enzyme